MDRISKAAVAKFNKLDPSIRGRQISSPPGGATPWRRMKNWSRVPWCSRRSCGSSSQRD